MMLKTHIAVGLAVALYFLPHINNKTIFFLVVLIASLLPDAGAFLAARKKGGRGNIKKIRFFSGAVKSYTLCVFVTLMFAFYYPPLALPFFLGYSFHLFLDAFTPEGIMPFWPIGKVLNGKFSTGGTVDNVIFAIFSILAFAFFIKLFI